MLTLILAAPVVLRPSERLFGSELVGFHPDEYIVIDQFESAPRLSYLTQPATDWLGVGLARLFGGVIAFNFVVLITFPLATLFAYLLARKLELGTATSVLASFAYGFAPFHLAHAAYHPHVSQTQWLPLYLLALILCLERWTVLRGVLLALATTLLIFSNFYAGLIGAVLTPAAILLFWSSQHRGHLREAVRPLLATTLTLGTMAGLGVAYAFRLGSGMFNNPRFIFPYDDLFRYCARWWSYLVPPVDHPLFGAIARSIWWNHDIRTGLVEQQVYLGYGMIAMAIVALLAYWRGERDGSHAFVPALTGVALIAFYFSLPPEGHWLPLPRPSALLHHWLPMFRAHARFGLVVQLMVFLLAAIGLATLVDKRTRRARSAAIVLLSLAVIELAPLPPWRWHWVLPTAAHRWIDGHPAKMRVLDCHDARPGERYRIGRMQRPTRLLSSTIPDCAEPGIAEKLAALGFSHMLVRGDYRLGALIPKAGVETEQAFGDSRVLAVTAKPPPAYVARMAGFFWRETEDDSTFRWMGADGALVVINTGDETVRTLLQIELSGFPGQRGVGFFLNDEEIGESTLTFERESYSVGPMELRPGRSVLVIRARGDSATPDEILGNGDRREITLRAWSWQWTSLNRHQPL